MINLGTINQKPVLQIFTHYFEPSQVLILGPNIVNQRISNRHAYIIRRRYLSSLYKIEKFVAAFQCNIHSDFRNPYLIYGAKINDRELTHFVLHPTISFGVSAI